MFANLVKPLRFAAVVVWLGVFAAYGLAPTTVVRAGSEFGWCFDQGCRKCTQCAYCESQPPNPPGGECWTPEIETE